MNGTTLCNLTVGQRFVFCRVIFRVKAFNDDKTVSCSVGDSNNTVLIMAYSWVYIYKNRFKSTIDWLRNYF